MQTGVRNKRTLLNGQFLCQNSLGKDDVRLAGGAKITAAITDIHGLSQCDS